MKISVVMAVYNGAAHLEQTIDSVLAQSETEFEFIIVDDGSTDTTPEILSNYAARDSRIRVLKQDNRGLTRALIRGCAAATAPFIARHDAGDLSDPERFQRQLALFGEDVVLTGCSTAVVGPELEPLYVVRIDAPAVRESLLRGGPEEIRGIAAHGSAMFRRDAYERTGGYREEFYFAQDLDLWVRLARIGAIASTEEVLLTLRVEPGSLTTANHERQVALKALIVALRDGGEPESLLRRAAEVRPVRGPKSARSLARGYYFIGRVLQDGRHPRAKHYLRETVRHDPLHARGWIALLREMLRHAR